MALGLEKGDRIGIWSPNWADVGHRPARHAADRAILVNINPANRAAELEYALRQSGCTALIIAPPLKTSNYAAILAELAIPELRSVIAFGDQTVPGALSWNEVLRLGDAVPEPRAPAREREQHFDDPVNIQYTSGTTGFPKGATLSHHSIVNNAFFIAQRMRLTERDRLCIPVPFYHCFGMVLGNLACVTHGATMVIPAPSFDAGETLATVAAERCTALHGVPTMFIAELDHPTSRIRPVHAADRHHGRQSLPGRGDAGGNTGCT
jgi:fatty-acyl-CoA synthase